MKLSESSRARMVYFLEPFGVLFRTFLEPLTEFSCKKECSFVFKTFCLSGSANMC